MFRVSSRTHSPSFGQRAKKTLTSRKGMLREVDARAARLNISRQAVIKTLLGPTL